MQKFMQMPTFLVGEHPGRFGFRKVKTFLTPSVSATMQTSKAT